MATPTRSIEKILSVNGKIIKYYCVKERKKNIKMKEHFHIQELVGKVITKNIDNNSGNQINTAVLSLLELFNFILPNFSTKQLFFLFQQAQIHQFITYKNLLEILRE
jgi:hypothetical protein